MTRPIPSRAVGWHRPVVLVLYALLLIMVGCGSEAVASSDGDPMVDTTALDVDEDSFDEGVLEEEPTEDAPPSTSEPADPDEPTDSASTDDDNADGPANEQPAGDDDQVVEDETGEDDEPANDRTEPAEPIVEAPPAAVVDEPTTGDPELDALIDELSVFVENERGLSFTSRPDVALLDGEEFSAAWAQLITDDASENADDYETFTDIYQAMGIISTDRTLEDIWLAFGEAGVLGYYEKDTEQIRLRAGEINALTQTTLAHELVHALEDQNFDINRDYGENDDERSWAFSSLIEGSARVIENRYRATLTADELAEEQAALRALPRSVSLSDFRSSFLELQFGRYNYGEAFALALWAEGQTALDQAFLAPPTSSELVLDPARYLRGALADEPVAPPPADGQVVADGVWGEAAWIAVLADEFGVAEARGLADGWGGDWYVVWDQGSETCVRIDIEADSDGELDEYETALERWVGARSGRDLSAPADGLLRLTSCG